MLDDVRINRAKGHRNPGAIRRALEHNPSNVVPRSVDFVIETPRSSQVRVLAASASFDYRSSGVFQKAIYNNLSSL